MNLFYIYIALILSSCGREVIREVPVPGYPAPEPRPVPPGPSPNPGAPAVWSEIKPMIDKQCGEGACHAGAGFMASEAAFKASRSKSEIESGDMPLRFGPNYGTWNDEKKLRIMGFLSSD